MLRATHAAANLVIARAVWLFVPLVVEWEAAPERVEGARLARITYILRFQGGGLFEEPPPLEIHRFLGQPYELLR